MAKSILFVFVLYEPDLDFVRAAELGTSFFEKIGIKPNDIGYKVRVPLESNASGIKSVRSVKRLIEAVNANVVEHICISHLNDNRQEIAFYFGYPEGFEQYRRLIIDSTGENILSNLVYLTKDSIQAANAPYGFATQINNMRNPYAYVDASTVLVPPSAYEDPSLWGAEVPNYLSDGPWPRRYLKGMMRLVYEYNFITTRHLSAHISGSTLKEWIENKDNGGKLEKIGPDMWLWHVPVDELPSVNQACADAGLLIAWRTPERSQPPVRRLP